MKLANLLRRRERATALGTRVLVCTLVSCMPGIALGGVAYAAKADGTVKIDGKDVTDPNDPANDPKLACAIPMEFQGFDAGETFKAVITFAGQGGDEDPVVSGGSLTPTFTGQGAGVALFQTYYVAGAQHVKITVNIDNGYNKSKVFKVKDCPEPTFTVTKANDADGNGNFNATETALAGGAQVPFKATITNTSPYDILVSKVEDSVDLGVGVPVTCAPALTRILSGEDQDCFFTLPAYAPTTGSKSNIVTVTAHQFGAPGVSASSRSATSVVKAASPGPDLKLTKTGPPGPLAPGATGSYSLLVENLGPSPAVGTITVIDTLPTGVVVADGTSDGFTCAGGASGGIVTCTTLAGIAGGTSRTIVLPAIFNAAGDLLNTATVNVTGDTDPDNNTDTAPTSVVATIAPSVAVPPVVVPPVVVPPVAVPPVNVPPVAVPPVEAPPVNAPPVNAPPVNTPPVNTPPVNAPPAVAPPVGTPPGQGGGTPISGVVDNPVTGEESESVDPAPADVPVDAPVEVPGQEPADQPTTPISGTAEEPAGAPSRPQALPFTGGSTDTLLALAAGLALGGLALALAGRRRRSA